MVTNNPTKDALTLMTSNLKEAAMKYNAEPRPGKIATEITKPTETQDDLSLAYTPGLA